MVIEKCPEEGFLVRQRRSLTWPLCSIIELKPYKRCFGQAWSPTNEELIAAVDRAAEKIKKGEIGLSYDSDDWIYAPDAEMAGEAVKRILARFKNVG